MASVTQTTPNFLGGVSKQPDAKKSRGQVSEIINGSPDPTFGLMKRPGFSYVQKIGDTPDFLNVKWFYAFRDKQESYFANITPTGKINIWDSTTGEKANVVVGSVDGTVTDINNFSSAYLSGTLPTDYDVLTVQDTSYITNKTRLVETQAKPSWTALSEGTVRIQSVEYSASYTITIDGTEYTHKTRNGDNVEYDPSDPNKHTDILNADEILKDLKALIDGGSSGVTVTLLKGSLELDKSTAFTLQAKGGITNEGLEAYQDAVENVAKLASETVHNRIVKVINTAQEKDSYYTKYIADDGISGVGYWEECRGPEASPGLDNDSMPHQLLSLGLGRWVYNSSDSKYDFETDDNPANEYTFMFKPVDYTLRLVGDEKTNTDPSFVNSYIQQAFFFSNRLGFLTSDNVSMSQAGEYGNFFHVSALAQIASDPVDISCSSIRPALLSGVVPVAQGLLLFSKTQQFLMYSDDGNLSPTDAIIATVSNYEYDIDIEPVSSGTRVNFISKTKIGSVGQSYNYLRDHHNTDQGYSRVFGMVIKGINVDPTVIDISSVVADWIPNTVDQMIASPQNSFIAMAGVNSREIYFFRTHSNGEKDIMQAWYKWKIPGNVQSIVVNNDICSVVIEAGGEYSIIRCILNVVQDDTILVNNDGVVYGNPCVDMFAQATDLEVINGDSYVSIPFNDITELEPIVMLSLPPGTDISDYPGLDSLQFVTTRDNGKFVVEGFDLSIVENLLVVGYKYEFDVTLPTVYYEMQDSKDLTASLTISNMKIVAGLSDKIQFKVNARGSEEWEDVTPVMDDQLYIPDTESSTDQQAVFHLPIHQRNSNFNVRVVSDSPFPVSLIAMAWQGNYSPKFYRRS